MPKEEKPARLIENLLRSCKQKDARIADLERQLAEVPERIQAALDAAAEHHRAEMNAAVAELELNLAGLQRSVDDATAGIHRHGIDLAAKSERIADLERNLGHALRRAETAEADLAAVQPRIDDLAAKERALIALVERHQERMNKREREAAAAILNRQALVGLLPGGGGR